MIINESKIKLLITSNTIYLIKDSRKV